MSEQIAMDFDPPAGLDHGERLDWIHARERMMHEALSIARDVAVHRRPPEHTVEAFRQAEAAFVQVRAR